MLSIYDLKNYLDTSNPVRRDECGDLNIFGSRGKVFTDREHFYIYAMCATKKQWTHFKKALFFMEVSQDGETEGILKLNRYPQELECIEIRAKVGLRKSPELSEEHLAELIARLHKLRVETRTIQGVNDDSMR